MTNYERDHLNPPNDKEIKTTECEYCNGDGWIYLEHDPEETKQTCDCPKCNGLGYLEYLKH